MPKGYWIGHVDVEDVEAYKGYVPASTAAVSAHGGRFLVRGGACEGQEGDLRARHVVVEFPSYAAALACYRSPEYQQARALRTPHSRADLVVVEGWD